MLQLVKFVPIYSQNVLIRPNYMVTTFRSRNLKMFSSIYKDLGCHKLWKLHQSASQTLEYPLEWQSASSVFLFWFTSWFFEVVLPTNQKNIWIISLTKEPGKLIWYT